MLLTIGAVILGLVVINFLLLIFSCNKSTKKALKDTRQPIYKKHTRIITTELQSAHLAPTGS
ncbi:hypothetical protein SAMN03097699_0868 [Flavobacteriaceae bacterium MAR_2010_188]|nr:hypothetical protein SAMN03097699_0868 [Flavobacteriaceae bacterium MAR_2010_188]